MLKQEENAGEFSGGAFGVEVELDVECLCIGNAVDIIQEALAAGSARRGSRKVGVIKDLHDPSVALLAT
jgi:hypothetical protein